MIAATMFSGIGAPECAMPAWDWRWHAEIEAFPSAVLRVRHPKSVNLGDINAEDFVDRAVKAGRPDVLIFGSPCQDFSVAGQRVGMDGARGNLAIVALGVVKRLRPRWFLFENVPGLFSSYSGSAEAEREVREGPIGGRADGEEDSDFAAFLSAVRECGYLGCYRVLDAQFAGVPQRRRRIFFVGHFGDWRPAAAVLLESDGLRGDRPPSREKGKRVAPTVEARANAGGAGWGTDFMSGGGLACAEDANPDIAWALQERDHKGPDSDTKEGHLIVQQVAPPLNAGMGKRRGSGAHGDGMVPTAYRSTGNDGVYPTGDKVNTLTNTRDPNHTVIAFETRNRGDDGRGYDRPPNFSEDVAPAVNTVKQPAIAFTCKDYGGDASEEQAPTLRAMEFDTTHANGGGQVAVAFQTRIARNGRGQPDEIVPALNGADAGATSDMRPMVAVFKPSHFTRDKDGAPNDITSPLGAEPDKGDQDQVLMTGTAVRRLTPRECERLQAFEDDYTLIEYRGKPAADGPRYKALGNSMCVKDVRWILARIERFEATVGRPT